MRIIIAKFSAWTYEVYKHSEHPEYVTIRNIIERHPQHRFILIGQDNKYGHFKMEGIDFYNVNSKGKIGFLLSCFFNFQLAVLLRPSVTVVLGNINMIPFGLESAFTRSKLVPVVTGEIGYSMHSVPKPIRFVLSTLLNATLRNSKTILSLSKSIRGELVIGSGIDPGKIVLYKYRISDAFSPNVSKNLKATLNSDGPVVLTLSRISREKGLEYLIEATRRVVEKMPEVRVVIKGSTRDLRYKKMLLNLVNQYELERNVTFLDFSSYSEVPKFLAASDIFVLPSISEGLPLVVMEAMASGVPVVASRVGGIPDILRDGYNGLMVEPANPELLAEALLRLLNDEELKERLATKALETVRHIKENDLERILNKILFQE